jgi:hypothetical protein
MLLGASTSATTTRMRFRGAALALLIEITTNRRAGHVGQSLRAADMGDAVVMRRTRVARSPSRLHTICAAV